MQTRPFRNRLTATALLAAAGLLANGIAAAADEMTVYQTEYCGGCDGWIDHVRDEGFSVTAHDVDFQALSDMKRDGGLSPEHGSCHTTWVNGYLIEGHVPADAIRQLLDDAPDIIGLTAPGMPAQSPGMVSGNRFSGFDVLAVDQQGASSVFKRY
ncbi:MAG: DUF411 domain-containing protein [Ectothiorhodospiraceae bacterium]|nr:DUF411 domain-containing protein [Ectothiorhodospiraceae bacterium]